MSEDLHTIGYKNGSLKYNHSHNGSNMFNIYESYFEKLRDRKTRFFEIGVYNGDSLRTWKEYFSDVEICAIDIDPECKKYEDTNIHIGIGSQDDPIFIEDFIAHNGSEFDVILDDGSHINKLTIASFNLLFKYLKPGGIYILEDMHCTYDKPSDTWPGMIYNREDVIFENNRSDIDKFLLDKIKSLDNAEGEIFSIHVYSKTYVILKNR